jgi:hypothetical protein
MLEDLAIQYTYQTEATLRGIGYGLIILGAVISSVISRNKSVLLRAPYYAYSGVLFLLLATAQFIWLESLHAMAGGYLWVFFSIDVISYVVFGYFFGIISMARSRDAYGHARNAVLAFIPLANLVLLVKPSKNERSADPTIPLLTGGAGVLIGFVSIAAGVGLSHYLTSEVQRIADEVQSDPAAQLVGIKYLLQTQGLEATVKQLAAEVPSQQIDEITLLRGVEADGSTLRYIYDLSIDADALPMSLRTGLVQQNCANEVMRPVIEANATLEHVYLRRDGSEIGTIVVTRQICGF